MEINMEKEAVNVGKLDSVIRIILGIVCVAAIIYHFAVENLFSIYTLIPVFILVPLFLKTGLTKICPIMKALKISTIKKS
jgi:hypothetical protein